jgi:hypothetical protein
MMIFLNKKAIAIENGNRFFVIWELFSTPAYPIFGNFVTKDGKVQYESSF